MLNYYKKLEHKRRGRFPAVSIFGSVTSTRSFEVCLDDNLHGVNALGYVFYAMETERMPLDGNVQSGLDVDEDLDLIRCAAAIHLCMDFADSYQPLRRLHDDR